MSTKITINHLDARLILHSRKIGLSTYQLLKAIHQGRIIQDIETGNYILKSHKKELQWKVSNYQIITISKTW